MKAFAELVGDFVDLVAFVNFDRLVGSVEHDLAVLASGGVGANFGEELAREARTLVLCREATDQGFGEGSNWLPAEAT